MPVTEIAVGRDVFRCQPLKEGFTPNLDEWQEEGLGRFRLEGEKMLVDAREGGYTAFYRQPLPPDLLARFTVATLPPDRQKNINLISHCRPPQPGRWPIVELGRYKGYQAMPNYIVTFVGAYDRDDWGKRLAAGRTRLRRNPGFHLIQETERENAPGREYEVTFAAHGGRIRYYIDGEKIHDWQDPAPLDGGFFGLRTFCTVLEYSRVLLAHVIGS